jgi:hypothetical protein
MGIEVIARGWERSDWWGEFYPEDLPEDWRLSYFANAFQSVLVPAASWREAPRGRLAQWAEDVPDRFRFYLELDASDGPGGWGSAQGQTTLGMGQAGPHPAQRSRIPKPTETPDLALAAAALGDRFAGCVAGLLLPASPAGSRPGSGTEPMRALVARDAQGQALLAREIPLAIVTDPRAALSWLAALAAQAGSLPALAILDSGSPWDLTRWCQLVLLGGFA